MSLVVNATHSDFDNVVLKSSTPVLVDFWASWCTPCRAMAPILDELSITMKDSIKIVKVNVENPDNQNLSMRYDIRSIPNMKLFKNGVVVEEFVGLRPKEILEQELQQSLV